MMNDESDRTERPRSDLEKTSSNVQRVNGGDFTSLLLATVAKLGSPLSASNLHTPNLLEPLQNTPSASLPQWSDFRSLRKQAKHKLDSRRSSPYYQLQLQYRLYSHSHQFQPPTK